jgi:hypothetical protein
MSISFRLRAALLLFTGAALACGSPPPATTAGADTANGGPVSWNGEEESCGFVEVRQEWTPGALVREYVRRDGDGEFMSSAPWLDSALTCAGHLPGWDAATVITDVEVSLVDSSEHRVRYALRYAVAGTLQGGNDFERAEMRDEIVMTVVETPWGWRIGEPQLAPRVLPLAAIGAVHPRPNDSAMLALVAAGRVGGRGRIATLLLEGEDWSPRTSEFEWWGVYEPPGGGWTVQRVVPKPRMVHDACREQEVAVTTFDPAGAKFAFQPEPGVVEGEVRVVSGGTHFVAPGDSVVLPRPIRGSYQLRATGRKEEVSYGTVVHDYALFLMEEDGEHGYGMLVWRGTYSEVAPSVEWLGDLNHDTDLDVLVRVPTGEGFGMKLQLLLTADTLDGPELTPVAEWKLSDC